MGGNAYGKATGLYNKHRKYSEQWNPWHPFQSAHNFQQAQSFSQQMKRWIDQHLRHGLDNFNIESFQSADGLRQLLSEHNFGLGSDSWIEDHSHIFGTLYYRDIFKCIPSAKNISVRAEWLRQSGHTPSEPSDTPRWWITSHPASIECVALHIALRSPFRRCFSL